MQGNEGTFTFLENVLKEVLELFPSQHIHIGGDEVGFRCTLTLGISLSPALVICATSFTKTLEQVVLPNPDME